MDSLKLQSFSLGMDKWINFENHTFITFILYYVTSKPSVQGHQLFTVDASDAVDWNEHFTSLDLKMCTAAVVNFNIDEDEILKDFLLSHSK